MKKSVKFIAKEFGKTIGEIEELLSDTNPDGRSHSEYKVPVYSEETISKAAYDKNEMDYFDWYCDNCNAPLNHQFGFAVRSDRSKWVCDCCGYENSIDKDNIIF